MSENKLQYGDIREGVVISLRGADIDVDAWIDMEIQSAESDGQAPLEYNEYHSLYNNALKDGIIIVNGVMLCDLSKSLVHPNDYSDFVFCDLLGGDKDNHARLTIPPDELMKGHIATQEDYIAWADLAKKRAKVQASVDSQKKQKQDSLRKDRDKFYEQLLIACVTSMQSSTDFSDCEHGVMPARWFAEQVEERAWRILEQYDEHYKI